MLGWVVWIWTIAAFVVTIPFTLFWCSCSGTTSSIRSRQTELVLVAVKHFGRFVLELAEGHRVHRWIREWFWCCFCWFAPGSRARPCHVLPTRVLVSPHRPFNFFQFLKNTNNRLYEHILVENISVNLKFTPTVHCIVFSRIVRLRVSRNV